MAEHVLDLNADVGELPGATGEALDAAVLEVITSANVACGGHAGTTASMFRVCREARRLDVAVGAQVSYPDVQGFGRRPMVMAFDALVATVSDQIAALRSAAAAAGTEVRYVRPHGALYHSVATNADDAAAVLRASVAQGVSVVLAQPDALITRLARDWGVASFTEAFADRAYRTDGSLVPRGVEGAVVSDRSLVVGRVTRLAREGLVRTMDGGDLELRVDSICLHGDTPGAVDLARTVRSVLDREGVTVRAFTAPVA